MRVYSNMSSVEFIAQLRGIAIKANAGPLFIDQIDVLAEMEGLEEQLEKADEEITQVEKDCDRWREAFRELLAACIDHANPDEGHEKEWAAAIKAAELFG